MPLVVTPETGMLRFVLGRLAFPFWNPDERRFRAAWRVLLQLAFFVVLSMGLTRAFRGVAEARDQRIEAVFSEAPLFLLVALVMLVSVWLACHFLDRRPLDDLGLRVDRRFWFEAGFGTVLGVLLMGGILGVEVAFGWARYAEASEISDQLPPLAFAPLALFPFLAIGFYEELVSRGYHLTNLAEGLTCRFLPPRAAIMVAAFLSSAVFGIAHAGNPNATFMSTGNIVFAGMMLASGYVTTGRLGLPIGLHFSWNFAQNLFGMPVSGQSTFFYASLLQRDVVGDPFVTGGAFGPEAGLTGLVAMALGTMMILGWVRLTTGELRIHPSIATPPPRVRAGMRADLA